MTKKIYFCTECKKRIDSVEEILFVEDASNRGFCSESCILNFYRPYMDVFLQAELKLRKKLSIPNPEVENILMEAEEEHFFQKVLYSPDEVWLDTSELQEKYYTHILKIENIEILNPLYLIVTCSYFESSPSFVFHKTVTSSEALMEKYRTGNKIDIQIEEVKNVEQEIELPPELLEQMDLKKSQLLAELLAARDSSDIDFEEFMDYEKFLSSTLDNPDEIYEIIDEQGELMATFIKSFKEGQFCFYYVAICWKCDLVGVNEQILVPILSFPSTDNKLYQDYAVGEKTLGQVKN